MRTHCAICGDEINLLCDRHFEISLNKYACGKCVDLVEETQLRYQLAKLLKVKNDAVDAAAAAKRLGKAIKEHGLTVGETNAKD